MKQFKNTSFKDRPFKEWPFWVKREIVKKQIIFLCVGLAVPMSNQVAFEGDYLVKTDEGKIYVR